uniref:eIF-2-alpha kinase GCN2-like n=1 Tax=Styela clava TaxID=7725 RepID=UPI001939E569|nr:eIF-2-alpha kinase GCN2-like [Styela clava]
MNRKQKRKENLKNFKGENKIINEKKLKKNKQKKRRRNQLKKDKVKKRDKSHDSSGEREHLDSTGSTGFDINASPSIPVSLIEFNTKSQRFVYRGKCVDKLPSGCVVHIGIDKESGNPFAIHEWTIPCPARKKYLTNAEQAKVSKYLKIIKGVEHELHSLLKLNHANLVSYCAIRYIEEVEHIQVDVLQEFVAGTNLESKIFSSESVSLSEVRVITEQLLNALDYLHSHSVVHKNLKASSVTLDSRGMVRLTDYSIEKRLADLYKESHIEQPGVTFIDDPIPARNSKKGDILKLGMLILSLVQGQHIKEYPPDIPNKLPSVFQDFLNKCLAVEDRLRMTASELLDHNFLKPSISENLEIGFDHKNGLDENIPSPNNDSYFDQLNDDLTTYPIPPTMLSRIHSEFEELQWLGKGGFGDVVQVRNKLDGRYYAIKRILLDPRNAQFNKKIKREVKHLSRLNHENVVRYYNSWIETLLNPDSNSSETTSSINTTSKTSDLNNYVNSLGLMDDVEQHAPPPVGHSFSDWESVGNYSFNQDEDDDDEEEEDVFNNILRYESEDEESVMFEGENGKDKTNHPTSPSTNDQQNTETTDSSLGSIPKCYLYIQMEYCEKSTLREAIDKGLWDDKSRVWELFRETLDGLVHIHEQGMIHRDLKPQNIFLDLYNHIKIGDFGLATSHTREAAEVTSILDLANSKSEGGDSALTGRVGTALYVAPELNKIGSRTIYNQKVDMYSLGIIFFEMCYAGLQTKMERVKVLGNMRLEEIKFPDDFDDMHAMHNEAQIIKWCLNHSSDKRPTAAELLRSPLVPGPALEKTYVVKSVRQALQDPHSAPHRLLMEELFARPDNRNDDIFYDIDLHKGQYISAQHLMQDYVHSTVITILKRHGAVKITPPLLTPRKRIKIEEDEDEENEAPQMRESEGPSAATFIDTSGAIVTLPYDLRVPFARYIGRNGIYSLKRYAIEKVYRKVKIHRSHPKELWECAFDIVTPTVCSLIPDAEGICAVSEIISSFPVLGKRSYQITVNHTILLLAIFAYSGISINKYDSVKRVLTEAKMEKLNKTQLEARLLDLSLTSQQISTLYSFIGQQGPLSKIQTLLKTLTRNKQSPISSLARQGLHELDALRKNLEAFGVRLPVVVHLGFVHNLHQYSGVIFQVSTEIRKQKKIMNEVIAAGGRYDDLVQRLSIPQLNHVGALKPHDNDGASHATTTKKHCAFGVSVAIERIVMANLAEHQSGSKSSMSLMQNNTEPSSHSQHNSQLLSNIDVLVAVMGRSQLFQERIRILKQLWDAGIRAEMTLEGTGSDADSLEILQEIAVKRSVSHLVVLKDKDALIKVRSCDQVQGFTKQQEKSLRSDELVDYLLRKIKESEEGYVPQRHSIDHSATVNATTSSDIPQSTATKAQYHRLNIEVLPPDKLAYNIKKRYESQAYSRLTQLPILQHISGKAEVYALAVDLPTSALKTLVQGLETGRGEEEFNTSVAAIISQLPKYKKYFAKITEMISEARFFKEVPLIILYSYKDDIYRLLS